MAIAETTTKMAVQVPWREMALRAVERVMRALEVEVTQPVRGEDNGVGGEEGKKNGQLRSKGRLWPRRLSRRVSSRSFGRGGRGRTHKAST